MSDCSSKAFEVPKTCGNCGHSLIGDCVADEYRNAHLNALTDCGDWFSLEQRYQQLEQVAKNMLAHIYICETQGDFPSKGVSKMYYEMLRECGVSLDD